MPTVEEQPDEMDSAIETIRRLMTTATPVTGEGGAQLGVGTKLRDFIAWVSEKFPDIAMPAQPSAQPTAQPLDQMSYPQYRKARNNGIGQ